MLEQTGKGKETPLVQMEKVTKRYGRAGEAATVLKDFDLEVQAGDYLAIMGRSGSGKTTLLNLLGAMDRDYEGVLRLKGREMKSLSEGELADFRNRSVGFIFQTFNLIPHLTVLENISLPGFFRDDAPRGAEAKAQASSCLARVRLDGFGGRHPLQLSGGERQRVAIARALYQRPQIVLCDEPTGSLDADNAEQIMALFEGLNKDLGVTLIVVTHDPQVAARARRMVRIDDVGAAQEVGG